MGMFSWCCKGCGHELVTSEYVRMNGCKGTYDGYGGCSGGFDWSNSGGESPVCWHEACYQKAPAEARLNESGSRHAGNQGFGAAALAFLKGFDENKEILFKPVIVVRHYHREKEETQRWEFYAVKTDSGYELQDYNAWKISCEDDTFWDSLPTDWMQKTSVEEQDRLFAERSDFIKNTIGMNSPKVCSAVFSSFAEAKQTVESLLDSLPNPEYGFSLCIFGTQGVLEGLYFQRDRTPRSKKVKTGAGDFDYEITETGEFRDNILYSHGIEAQPQEHWSQLIENV